MFTKFIADLFNLNIRESWAVGVIVETFKSMFSSVGSFFKQFVSSILIIVEMFGVIFFGFPTTPRGEKVDLSDYKLVFEDNFDGDTLDTSKWQYRASGARRGGFNSDSQVSVKDGKLIIDAEYLADGKYGEGWYGGMINLAEKYKYGYFEIRCICNKGKEFWSAFWIQADHPYTPEISKGGIGGAEIDIFEAMSYGDGKEHNSVVQTIYCSGMKGDTSGELNSYRLGHFYGNDIYNEYNTYGLEWTEDEYIFYINGVETGRTSFADGVSQVPEQVIVSLEIPGEIDFEKDYRTEYTVDYVKIWQK